MARVVLKNLTKKFGNVIAVNNLDLSVEDKSFVVLVGPSGCGKSTTLRLIAGLEDPDEGEIYIGEEEVSDVDPKDRDIAMVFQSYALYPHMSVFDNIAFGLKVRKLPKAEIRKRVKDTANLLGVDNLLDRKPRQLSGGQMQRVALGRAIARSPKVFLFDEPLSNLDAKLRVQMRAELKTLQRELETTTVYVTHDQVEAMTLADKMAILNNGLLQQFDTPERVFERPANRFIAGFLGSPAMNFIDCTYRDGVLDAGEFSLRLTEELADIVKEKTNDSEIILGIRPQNISITREGDKKGRESGIKADVTFMEPLGTSTIIHLSIGKKDLVMETPEFIYYDNVKGLKMNVVFDIRKIHIFKKDGQAII